MCRHLKLFLNSFKKFTKLPFCPNMAKMNTYSVKKITVTERTYILATPAAATVLKTGTT